MTAKPGRQILVSNFKAISPVRKGQAYYTPNNLLPILYPLLMYRLSDNIMPLFSMERFRGADGSRREKEPCKFSIIYATRSIAKDIFSKISF